MNLSILLLCNRPDFGTDANTIIDHIDAIKNYSQHNVFILSMKGDINEALDLNKFDVIIVHYSIFLLSSRYISPRTLVRLREYQGLKLVFLQDEYRKIDAMIERLNFLKMDVLFSCFPEKELDKIYSPEHLLGLSKYNNLTGYIPERLLNQKALLPIADRKLDVGYRGRLLPFWYGELGYEKWNIVEKWKEYTVNENIKSDISYAEKDRIYGRKWLEFLGQCKTTLGVESGASVMDFTGKLEEAVERYQLANPKASFFEVQKLFLKEYENQFYLNQISPRCFEAIALKTVLVLYEGEYSGILKPNKHYIPLKKDFSNIKEVLNKIKDKF